MNNREKIGLFSVLALSCLPRALTLATPELWLDEEIVGLMGLRVLAGEFPLFFFGQSFMGSLEAYLTAVLFLQLGPSPFALELLPVLLSLVFLLLLFLFSKNIFGFRIALLSLGLISIPPFMLLHWSHEARPHYPLAIVFGMAIFLMTFRKLYRPNRPRKEFSFYAGLGLIAGIAWWTNYLSLAFVASAGIFLFLADKKILFQRGFYGLVLFFFLGSSPFWVYNFKHLSLIGGFVEIWTVSHLLPYTRDLFVNAFPILFGFQTPSKNDWIDLMGYLAIGPIYFAAILYCGFRFRSGLSSLLRFNLRRTDGSEMLMVLFSITILLNLLTNFGSRLSENDQKYLLPLYAGLPVFLALFLADIGKKSVLLSGVLAVLILGSNLLANLRLDAWTWLNAEKLQDYRYRQAADERLIRFLREKGHTRIYFGHAGKKLILKSAETVIAAHASQEIYPKYVDWVDSAPRPAYLSQEEEPTFEENVRALGGAFQKIRTPDGFLIYTDFKGPEQSFARLARSRWKLASKGNPGDLEKILDGDVATGWSPGKFQRRGQSLTVDLGSDETINKISYIPASTQTVPIGYRMEVSRDGHSWQEAVTVNRYWGPFFWSGPVPMFKMRHSRVESVFPPVRARYVRITLLHDSSRYHWSVQELFVYGPGNSEKPTPSAIQDPAALVRLLAFLEGQKIEMVYADHWLSSVLRVRSNWKIRTIASNLFLGENGENRPGADSFMPAVLNSKTVFILPPDTFDDFERLLKEFSTAYSKKEFEGWLLCYGFKTDFKPVPLPRHKWKVSANANGREASRAVDGKSSTRWTSLKTQEPGILFQVDLGAVQPVKGFSLNIGTSVWDFPRLLRVLGSPDGTAWAEIQTQKRTELYWSGEQLLKLTGEKSYYFFEPVRLRYLRFLQEGRDDLYFWSIHELEVF